MSPLSPRHTMVYISPLLRCRLPRRSSRCLRCLLCNFDPFFLLRPPMFLSRLCRIIIDRIRKGAVTSMIIVELAWLSESSRISSMYLFLQCDWVGFLWILWLSSAGTATGATILSFAFGCNYRNSRCSYIFQALE